MQAWAVGRAEGGGPGEDGAKGGSAFLPGLLITDAGTVPCPCSPLTIRSPSSPPGLFILEESLVFLPAPVTGRTEEIRLKTAAATA